MIFSLENYDYNSVRNLDNNKYYIDINITSFDQFEDVNMFTSEIGTKISIVRKTFVDGNLNYFTNDNCFLFNKSLSDDCDYKVSTFESDYQILPLDSFTSQDVSTRLFYLKNEINDEIINVASDKYNLSVDFSEKKYHDYQIFASNATTLLIVLGFFIAVISTMIYQLSVEKEVAIKRLSGYNEKMIYNDLYSKKIFLSIIFAVISTVLLTMIKYENIMDKLINYLSISLLIYIFTIYLISVLCYYYFSKGEIIKTIKGKRNNVVLQITTFLLKLLIISMSFFMLINIFQNYYNSTKIDDFQAYSNYTKNLYNTNYSYNDAANIHDGSIAIDKLSFDFYFNIRNDNRVNSSIMKLVKYKEGQEGESYNNELYYIITNSDYFDYVELYSTSGLRIDSSLLDDDIPTLLIPKSNTDMTLVDSCEAICDLIFYEDNQKTPYFTLNSNWPTIDMDASDMPLFVIPDNYTFKDDAKFGTLSAVTSGDFYIQGDEEVINEILIDSNANQNIAIKNINQEYQMLFSKQNKIIKINILFYVLFLFLSIVITIFMFITEVKLKAKELVINKLAGVYTYTMYKSFLLKYCILYIIAIYFIFTYSITIKNVFMGLIYLIIFLMLDLIIIALTSRRFFGSKAIDVIKGDE